MYRNESEKMAILSKLMPPHNLTVSQLAAQEGISTKTLYNWRKNANDKGFIMIQASKKNLSAEQKMAIVIETASLSEHDLSKYCREKGLFPSQVKQWKQDFIEGLKPRPQKISNPDKKKIKALEKEISRKDKALAETAALLVLSKKLETLWGDEES